MAIDNDRSASSTSTSSHKRPLARSLTRSYSAVTIMASETVGLDWHRLPRLTLSAPTSLALGGVAGAAMATAAVSPVVTLIDLSIIRAQADRSAGGLFGALRLTARDLWAGRLAWGRPLRLLTFVYGGTYLVANETQVACAQMGIDQKLPTAAAAGAFNIAAIAWKDHCFLRMFSQGPAKVLPLSSYGLMAARDGLTIVSSFVFKEQLREHLEGSHGMKHRDADLAASFAVPIAAQLFNTPLHILAMDLPNKASVAGRAATIASKYSSVLTGRVMRILPAFGLGGFINDVVKESFFLHNDVPYEKI